MMPIGREFCVLAQEVLHPKTVLEVGSKPAVGQEELTNLRTVFTDAKRYVGIDLEAGPGVDQIVDICEPVWPNIWHLEEFELCLCIDMLEHCRYPEQAVFHMREVAQHLVLRTAFCAPIHNHPNDYWRFTPALLQDLCSAYEFGFVAQDAPVVSVPASEVYDWPHGVYAFGTEDETLRNQIIALLNLRPVKDIMVVSSW